MSIETEPTKQQVYISGNNNSWVCFDKVKKEFIHKGDKGFLFKKNDENRSFILAI